MQPILDSLSELKDGEAKDHIVGVVKDCFEDRSMVADSKEAVVSILDSAYAVALKETDDDMKVLDSVEPKDPIAGAAVLLEFKNATNIWQWFKWQKNPDLVIIDYAK